MSTLSGWCMTSLRHQPESPQALAMHAGCRYIACTCPCHDSATWRSLTNQGETP